MNTKMLVLGGVRSGKSRFAEAAARLSGLELVYLATGQAFDQEMRARVEQHRAARAGLGWRTIEEPLDLSGAVAREAAPDRILLVDCLTLWLTNLMVAERDLAAARAELVERVAGSGGPLILVSNEVGLGGVSSNAMARAFTDHTGHLHQDLAAVMDQVVLLAAGLPLWLKGR